MHVTAIEADSEQPVPNMSPLLLLLLVLSASAHVYYVRPDEFAPAACPGHPCLTLDQYIQQAETYFTTGATFLFLPGNHSLKAQINIDYSNISLKGNKSVSQIVYKNDTAALLIMNTTNLTINDLTFIFFTGGTQQQLSALKVLSSQILISNCLFQGSGNLVGSRTRAVYSQLSNVTISSCHFEGNTGNNGGAVYASDSILILASNNFTRNRAENGSAVYAHGCNISITTLPLTEFSHTSTTTSDFFTVPPGAAVFHNNSASGEGGAVYFINCSVLLNGEVIMFSKNLAEHGAGIYIGTSYVKSELNKTHIFFIKNNLALFLNNSMTYIQGNVHFFNNYATGLYIYTGSFHVSGNTRFMNNRHGAIQCRSCILQLSGNFNNFTNNTGYHGGGIHCDLCELQLSANFNNFINNTSDMGGAIFIVDGKNFSAVGANFVGNVAAFGGAIHINISLKEYGSIYMASISSGYFINNRAHQGGAMYIIADYLPYDNVIVLVNITAIGNSGSAFNFSNCDINFTGIKIGNNTGQFGGGLCMMQSIVTFNEFTMIGNNTGQFGGGLYMKDSTVIFHGFTMIGNNTGQFGGGFYIDNTGRYAIDSVVIFMEFTMIGNNTGEFGGGLYIDNTRPGLFSTVTFNGYTIIGNNTGQFGGGLYVVNTGRFGATVTFKGFTIIRNNTGEFGGGLYLDIALRRSLDATRSDVIFNDFIFMNNKAEYGGAIYSSNSYITFKNEHSELALFYHNSAIGNGGAICTVGNTRLIVNPSVQFDSNSARNGGAMHLNSNAWVHFGAKLLTSNNSASEYGGAIYYEDAPTQFQCNYINQHRKLLPECYIHGKAITEFVSKYDSASKGGSFMYGGLIDRCRLDEQHLAYEYINNSTLTHAVSSKPYQLCFCENKHNAYNCSEVKHLVVLRGKTLRLALVALNQMRNPVTTNINATLSNTARLEVNQSLQKLHKPCSLLTYNLYSIELQEKLVLYPDGPCHDIGLARAVVNITFACPDGFVQLRDQCVCDERLQVYSVNCKDVYIIKHAGSNFWMSGSYKNQTYLGPILCKTCPFDYCKTSTVNLTLDNPDTQCAHNRGGVLCGQCTAYYSLTLGTDHCQVCSNAYLALLLPFAAAGVALVVFLTFLRLTVATGMINSLILYANIVQVNRNLFISSNTRNILTVFIAWMNLDLGFKTCFYNGMDAYAQTWLQFAFPVYVWTLITLIIVTSRYSIFVSKLIGHNPIAVLATLILMSYTKILKIVIEVYSSVNLEYPDNKTVTVWLKDANVPYLQSKHLLLTVVTSLVLVFFFLPYTLLLLLGHKLYRFTGRKGFRWFSKVRPLLDSYYAPYKTHTRYWTGFLLLVRCALYMVFSYNSLGAANKSLLAITITFTVITAISGYLLAGKVYNNFFTNLLEALSYLNLVLLSTTTLAGANSPALVYTLVGTVFAIMIGITVYHFHLIYTAKSAMWLRVKEKLSSVFKGTNDPTANPQPPPVAGSSQDPHKIVSKTVVELREPLLDTSN